VRLDEECGVGAYFASDKADEKVKKGMAKCISKWSPALATEDFPDGQVYICLLDSDGTGATTEEGANGVANSLMKLPNHETIVFWGVIADSGGGFTREPKKDALVDRGFCEVFGLVGNCTLHNIQLTGTVPMKHLFRKGAVNVRSLPQMLFLGNEFQQTILGRRMTRELLDSVREMYELELDEDEIEEWQAKMKDHKEMLLMKPDDARWMYTAFAVDRLERNLELWKTLADKYLESKIHTPTEKDIVGNFISLMEEPEVLVDLALTAGFFRGYFFPHFVFLQGVDPNIGKPGFLSFHILVHIFLMLQDLDRLSKYRTESQNEVDAFVAQVNEMPQDKQEAQHKKAQDFFQMAKDELLKMFDRWMDNRLFFLSAFGEAPTGSLVARYILSSEPISKDNAASLLLPTEDAIYDSPLHGCKIDRREFCTFLAVSVCQESLTSFKNSYHYGINRQHFEFIASGHGIWDQTNDSSQIPRTTILIRYGGFPSNTQMMERGNKNHNICSANSRKDRAVNARITSRSLLIDVASVTTVGCKREASSGRAHKQNVFGKLADFDEAEKDCRRRLSQEERDYRDKYIKKKMFDRNETFEEKEFQAKKKSVNLKAESKRVPYAAELRSGYDNTPYLQNKVQYGKLGTIHVEAMRNELTARGIAFPPGEKIKDLCKRLKSKLRNDWKLQNPGVDEKVYDEDSDKTKYFHPLTGRDKFPYKEVR
jgi:hypothetical protein